MFIFETNYSRFLREQQSLSSFHKKQLALKLILKVCFAVQNAALQRFSEMATETWQMEKKSSGGYVAHAVIAFRNIQITRRPLLLAAKYASGWRKIWQ